MLWYFAPFFGALVVILVSLAIYDLCQKKHAILHNFPILGHFRYWLESIGPELRQYIVTSNNEERPFSRDERTWVYASSKRENNYFGFGTDNDLDNPTNYLILRHAAFPLESPHPGDATYDASHPVPSAKVLGEFRNRKKAFRPSSIINTSAMSFGSLSGPAVEAINRGAQIANCWQNTGEGGVSSHHQHGGDLVWQIGTAYFGCRSSDGKFDINAFRRVVEENPIRAIEIKLSQGAKPGKGGVLPAAKITSEISQIRGIPRHQDCLSPAHHTAFRDADEMLDFVEELANVSGLPVGIKSAVGQLDFWHDLVRLMDSGERGVDFITIDGGEGGTGAAPLVFSDHVALPFKLAIRSVYPLFVEAGLHRQITFVGSGRLGFPHRVLLAMTLGCDLINVGREAMLAVGCIQAQRCHTGFCPTGVATQNRWLMKGLDPTLKSNRLANYVITLRKEVMELSRACGKSHPALLDQSHFEILEDQLNLGDRSRVFGYPDTAERLNPNDAAFVAN